MKITNKHVFFWGGIYSQWYLRDIVIDNITYNCCEQYMMHQKALLFGDIYTAQEILEEKVPALQKKLGRKVINFDVNKWNSVAKDIVLKGNIAKFTQHKDLYHSILSTGDRILVEASPLDKIWGIGMDKDEYGVDNPENWRGTNWLGDVLTKVKKIIKEEGV